MDVRQLIMRKAREKGVFKTADIVNATGFSRVYINRFLMELREEGKIVLIGNTNRAKYVLADKDAVRKAKKKILSFRRHLINKGLSEDPILDLIKRETGIFFGLNDSISRIVDYAFTEMLNNAIEHSRSESIDILIENKRESIRFVVNDDGIGIYNNLMEKRHLENELEAIQELLKGKQTTAPKEHSGQGIFFTSKIADNFIIESSIKKLLFNNIIADIFIQNVKGVKGTRVTFVINKKSTRTLKDVFDEYSGESYEFDRTKVAVRLYKLGSTFYVSRSQARRVMNELDKFREVVLDFKHIAVIGQAFADQIFRVWHNQFPGIKIISINANENVDFMIRRAVGNDNKSQETI